MLIEVKVKVKRIVGEKTKKKVETYLVEKELFSEAEYEVMTSLTQEIDSHLVEEFEIQSLRISQVKEIANQYQGEYSFVATLKDIFLEDDGTEKPIRYKVLLWANDLNEAMGRTLEIASQGYNMSVEGLKEVDYVYLQDGEGTNSSER